ncbi:hypothetical protein BDW62DRAFT_197143 [Aspergillus aurantiobrunneus]
MAVTKEVTILLVIVGCVVSVLVGYSIHFLATNGFHGEGETKEISDEQRKYMREVRLKQLHWMARDVRACPDVETPIGSAPSTTSILDFPISTSLNTVWRERRAFAYYFEHAAQYLAGGFDQTFWTSVVPQICRTEPAVWDAVNTISALFEAPTMCLDFVFLSLRHENSPALDPEQSEALGWYSRSLSKIRTQIDRNSVDAQVALISCVLFICIETLQGHVEEALQLYNQGMRLILDLRAKGRFPARTVLLENIIVPLFVRLGAAALTISGVPVCDLLSGLNIGGSYCFTSLESARNALTPLAAKVQILQRESGSNPFIGVRSQITPEIVAKRSRLQEGLSGWHCAYTGFTQRLQGKIPYPESSNTTIAATLLAFHATLTTMVSTCLEGRESIYDAHIPGFRTTVEQVSIALEGSATLDGAQPAFTFELGVGLPLFWTALKCRDPPLRRKALELLQKAPPVQGFYKCAPGLMLAGKVMELEEGFSKQMLSSSKQSGDNSLPTPPYENSKEDAIQVTTIPEEARIQHYGVFRPRDQPFMLGPHDVSMWNRGPDQLFMRFTRNRRDPVDRSVWYLSDECVPMD